MRVLELGCGTGNLLAQLKPSYGLGVDFSPRMIEVAKRNHRDLEFVVGDVEDASFISELEGPFDYIVLSDTIGYLDDIERVFRVRCARSRLPIRALWSLTTLIFGNRLWRLRKGLGAKCRSRA